MNEEYKDKHRKLNKTKTNIEKGGGGVKHSLLFISKENVTTK